jgi:isocitrate dehydrogenase (NAD+)
MMLRHLGETIAADGLERAVAEVLRDGTQVTADLRAADDDRPAVGTTAMTDAVIARL